MSDINTPLEELCEFIVDCEHKTAPTQEEGYPSIRTPNIGRGYFILENVNKVSEQTYIEWTKRATPQVGDLILAREAPVGNVAVIPDDLKCCLGQRTVLIRPNSLRIDPYYLCFLLLTPSMQGELLGKSGGATVHHLNMRDIRKLAIRTLPSIENQKQIAHRIKAYDDLIETNRRRIALLEESARLLYREWFVNFRFPGHEQTKIVDGVPAGWKRTSIGELCEQFGGEIQTGPFGSQLHQHEYTSEGTPVVMPQDIRDDQISLVKISYVPDHVAQRLIRHKLHEGDIVFPRRGDISKRALIASKQQGYICGTGCLRIRVNSKKVPPIWLYHHLALEETCKWLENKAVGATMPNLNTSILASVPVLYPGLNLAREFAQVAAATKEQVDLLAEQNLVNQQARDTLLPKLMSGEFSV